MKKSSLFIILITFNLLISQHGFAKSTIFKCLDEFGRPIFSQQATCAKPETVNYSSKQLADKKKKQQEQKRQSADAKQKEQCNEAETTLASYKRAPFLTKMIVSDGKEIKIRLNKQEAQQAIADAEQEMGYWCNKK